MGREARPNELRSFGQGTGTARSTATGSRAAELVPFPTRAPRPSEVRLKLIRVLEKSQKLKLASDSKSLRPGLPSRSCAACKSRSEISHYGL